MWLLVKDCTAMNAALPVNNPDCPHICQSVPSHCIESRAKAIYACALAPLENKFAMLSPHSPWGGGGHLPSDKDPCTWMAFTMSTVMNSCRCLQPAPYIALGLTRSEKEKDFSIETFSGEELLICYVLTICALFKLFSFRIY